jgi:hypothetical protein
MSDLGPLSGEERKSNFGAVRSVDDLNGHSVGIRRVLELPICSYAGPGTGLFRPLVA